MCMCVYMYVYMYVYVCVCTYVWQQLLSGCLTKKSLKGVY